MQQQLDDEWEDHRDYTALDDLTPDEFDRGAARNALLSVFFWGVLPSDLSTLRDEPEKLEAVAGFIDDLIGTADDGVLGLVRDFGMPSLAGHPELVESHLGPAALQQLRDYLDNGSY